jgi:hypothetical protein
MGMNIKIVILLLCLSVPVMGQKYKTMVAAPITQAAGGGGTSWTNLERWYKLMTNTNESENSQHGTAYGASVSGDTCYVFDGDDSISIPAYTDGIYTIIFEAYPDNDGSANLFGGDENSPKLSMWTSYRLRFMQAGSGGTSVADLSLNNGQWNLVSVVVNGTANTVRFGVDGSYETETNWDYDPTEGITRIGGSRYDLNEFVGYIRNFVIFSDAKSDAYITAFYNSGNFTTYEDGDPL